jgi:23S rRNA (uracil1939-C5)-methyltransferase
MSPPNALVRIDVLAHGGEGLGALPSGKKVFVPLTAPGDLVAIEVVREKAQFARGRVVQVVEPGAVRRAPPCRHAARCGGCQLQQVSDEAQRHAKEEAFYAALERLGGVPRADIADARAIVPSPSVFGYRARCRLRVSGNAVGFCGWRSSAVVALEECPVLTSALERTVLALGTALARNPIAGARDLHVCVGDGDECAAALFFASAPGPATARAVALHAAVALQAAVPSLRGLLVLGPGVPAAFAGEPVLTTAAPWAPGVRLHLRPDLFAQANPAANALLVGLVLDLLRPTPDDVTLDLYAGAGNFTFAFAQRSARVIAVEESAESLALMRRAAAGAIDAETVGAGAIGAETANAATANAATASVEPTCAGLGARLHCVAGDAVVACERLAAEGRQVDLALMDPPRVGAKETPAALARLRPRRIAYVSCDPATLARDIRAFRACGYRVTVAVPVDMFPQTYHVEGVVLLERVA